MLTQSLYRPPKAYKGELNVGIGEFLNECEGVIIGFGFTSNWMNQWHKFFYTTIKHSNTKLKQMQITFGIQIKTALIRK